MRSFFSRLWRAITGLFLVGVQKVEDAAPEAILATEMDNFNRATADFNNGLGKQAGITARLKAQIEKQKSDITALTARVQALLKTGLVPEREKAGALVVTLNRTKHDMEENGTQLAHAEEMYQSLTRQRDAYVKASRDRIDSVKGKISQAKIAEAQSKLAEMASNASFNPDGTGLASLEDRLDERVADAQGKLRVANDAVASSPWALSEAEQKAQESSALADFEASLNPAPSPLDPPKA